MSSTTSNNGNGNNESSGKSDADWKAKVQQSYRNAEVRQIAKVLASLEPGASEASKLRLAMQFEDSIFKLGTSLADYHKRLTKRLKKLQKTYVPVVDAAASTREKERMIQQLIAKYGDDLRYIIKNAAAAIKEMREKYGEEKAAQLQQHTDGMLLWATELGLVENTQPNYTMSDQQFEKLKGQLEKRLQNVRSHTVKLVHPDAFLQESLQKIQDDFKNKERVVRVQAENMRKRYEQFQHASSSTVCSDIVDPEKLLQQALEQASKPVPMIASSASQSKASTNNTGASTPRMGNTKTMKQSELDARVRAAVLHLDKMRAASTVVLAYLCAPDKHSVPPTALADAHSIAMAGIEVVQDVMREHRQHQQSQRTASLRLQDAWLKPIVVPVRGESLDDGAAAAAAAPPSPKRPRLAGGRPVLRARVLLTAGRKTPSSLAAALHGKAVTLVRPPPSGAGSHVRLAFEPAFVMTIYLVPLLVTLRAHRGAAATPPLPGEEAGGDPPQQWKCGSWTPLSCGLPQRGELTVGGAVRGTYETVGLAVEERLRDASAHATQALRTCFANSAAAAANGDFEVELLEASALLEFVQLARDTYTPNWKDDATD